MELCTHHLSIISIEQRNGPNISRQADVGDEVRGDEVLQAIGMGSKGGDNFLPKVVMNALSIESAHTFLLTSSRVRGNAHLGGSPNTFLIALQRWM